jgi:hypothetical protein
VTTNRLTVTTTPNAGDPQAIPALVADPWDALGIDAAEVGVDWKVGVGVETKVTAAGTGLVVVCIVV